MSHRPRICIPEAHSLLYPFADESRLPVADRCTAIVDYLRRWSCNCHCYCIRSMVREATEFQSSAVWQIVRCVWCERGVPVGAGQVDQRRRQNSSILPSTDMRPARRAAIWRGYGVVLPCALTDGALAQDNATYRPRLEALPCTSPP